MPIGGGGGAGMLDDVVLDVDVVDPAVLEGGGGALGGGGRGMGGGGIGGIPIYSKQHLLIVQQTENRLIVQ